MSDAPRILIVRLSAIGDVVHASPLIWALRDHWPLAHIGWVTGPGGAQLLQGHPVLNKLHIAPKGWLTSFSAIRKLRSKLRAERYEIAIDPQGLTKSTLLAWLSGARRRIGLAPPDSRELAPWLQTESIRATATHIVDRNLEMLTALGVRATPARFDLPLDDEALARMRAWVVEAKIEPPVCYAVLNPGAGWPSKRWPPERHGAVARYIHQKHDLRSLVVWAGDEERAMAEQIVATADGAAILAPPTNLSELAALLNGAAIFVGSDTGPLHMAAAFNVPCVGLYGPMPAERNGPYGSKHIALQKARIDGPARVRRNAGPETMNTITVGDVCAAVDTLLAPKDTAAC